MIIVPALVTLWRTSDRIQRSQEVAGVERPAIGPLIFVLLLIIGPVGIWYAQNELNKAWEAQGTAGGTTAQASDAGPQAPR